MIPYLRTTPKSKLSGTALLRLDFNTKDDWRMRAVLPTLRLLEKTSSKIVIVSHRGRPTSSADKKLSLRKDAGELSRLLGHKVIFIDRFDFPKIRETVRNAPPKSIFLLENLRFLKGEEKNDPKLAKALASLADFYVNDAFAVSHRANASIALVPKFLPSYAGLELENEIKFLSGAMQKPKQPLVLILGGAKASDKLGVIAYFKNKAKYILLGGGPANTILAAKGMDVKKSLEDTDPQNTSAIKKIATHHNVILPKDFVWHDNEILDLGAKTMALFDKKIAGAKTILWSGPLGEVEQKLDARATTSMARAIAKNRKAFSIAGGGETVAFLKKIKLDKRFGFLSTGGGAMLDFLAGKKLPGIEALQ